MVYVNRLEVFEDSDFKEMILCFLDCILQKQLIFYFDTQFQKGTQFQHFYKNGIRRDLLKE